MSGGAQKLWIPGGSGMLGLAVSAHARAAGYDVTATGHEVDVTNIDVVCDFVQRLRPTAIINCAAFTRVDDAEKEPEAAQALNTNAAGHIGRAATLVEARALHISTDYVFGDHPPNDAALGYDEYEPRSGCGVYAQTKAAGEQAFHEGAGDLGITVRTSWLFGPVPPGGKNFVTTMLRLMRERDEVKVVADQQGRPTSTATLASALITLLGLDSSDRELHVADAGATTWHAFAVAIREGALARGLPVKAAAITPIPSSAYPTPAQRPAYSVLSTARYERLTQQTLPAWTTTLGTYLDELATK